MFKLYLKNTFFLILLNFFISFSLSAEIVKKIEVKGNNRVSIDTIKLFADIKLNVDVDDLKLNQIIKNLYNTNFFENISVEITNQNLIITVTEFPIIQEIIFEGLKANKIKEAISQNLILKSRSSFNEILLAQDKSQILKTLENLGYFFSKIDIYVEDIDKGKVNINYIIDLGDKAKIRKISFLGDKVFKDKLLKNVIVSEEFKLWKFISGKKYLNKDLNELDTRLLKNFYLNEGYYNVEINSTYAKLLNDNEFELIFNINANQKIYFNNLSLILPVDFDKENFTELDELFLKLKDKPYSINSIKDILDKLDQITVLEQYESINANVSESINENKIDLEFSILEAEKIFVEKINIFGNNVTRENVIRNQFELDEGDPYNEILLNKSLNNLKSLNFFKNVKSDVVQGSNNYAKIINITVEEKPTGEIFAGAGVGTSGSTITFGVKENNYLGKGLSLDTIVTLDEESINGKLSLANPNFKNSNKSIFFLIESDETDRLKDFGYKTNKTGFSTGTNFEFYDDFYTGINLSTYYEVIETDSTASLRQKAQKGNYFDSYFGLSFDFDKRDQKFQTSNGYRNYFSFNMPLISETNTLTSSYSYKYFTNIYKNNISSFSYNFKAAKSLTNEDIKLSERLYIPSNLLRGFEKGKIGPKDGDDFIGGNFISSVNFTSTIPQIFPNYQNADFLFFFDAANIWGVDYDSSLDKNDEIRSAIGLAIDWFTPIGPLNFSISHPITKVSTDITETFRFNLGTTF